jgi:hypothetical protein
MKNIAPFCLQKQEQTKQGIGKFEEKIRYSVSTPQQLQEVVNGTSLLLSYNKVKHNKSVCETVYGGLKAVNISMT